MNSNFELAKSILKEKGSLTGVTSGESMRPLFRDGRDKAVIIPLTKAIMKNDVLLYRKAATNEVILHRVVKIKDGKPILRGDGTFINEPNVPQNDILGIMEGFYRGGKYYSCKSKRYRLYVFFLRTLYPLRRFLHKCISLLKIIKRKINAPA